MGMWRGIIRRIVCLSYQEAMDAEYAPMRAALRLAGLSEQTLRNMQPDERVAALEKASLDPYDYIFLAC